MLEVGGRVGDWRGERSGKINPRALLATQRKTQLLYRPMGAHCWGLGLMGDEREEEL